MMSWISTTPQRQTSTPRRASRSPPLDITLIEEDFERLPKTDYTYAFSGSYSPRKLGASYTKPNMSRPGLRKSYVFERSAIDQMELPDDTSSSISNTEHDLRLADLPIYTPLNVNGPSNINNSGRYSLGPEAPILGNRIDRSATRSGTQYGLLWRKDGEKKGRRRSGRQSMPQQLPNAQKLQANPQESFIVQRPQPDLINSRHSMHRPDLPVPHLYGLDDSDDSENEYENDDEWSSNVPPYDRQSESWLAIIFRTILTIVILTVTTVAGATKSLLSKSSSLVLAAGSESHSFISKVFHWIWSLVWRSSYAVLFVCYFLVSIIKLAVVKIVRILTAPLQLSAHILYDVFEWNSSFTNEEANRSQHWLRSGKDRPEGEEYLENSESSMTSGTSGTQNEEEYHNREVITKKTTVTEWVTWTASLPLLAVRKPIEWYWKNVAGGDIEEDLPWLRSGRNRLRDAAVPRRRRTKRVVTDVGDGDEYESEEEVVINHVEEWKDTEETSSHGTAIIDLLHSVSKFLLLVVSLPFLIVLGPLVRIGRKLFGRRREKHVAWLRSGKNRLKLGKSTGDLISDSETEEEIVETEQETDSERTSIISWITTVITTTVWTTTNFVAAPGRWVVNKFVSNEALDESDSYKLDEILRENEIRRGSNSSESGYDSSADVVGTDVSDSGHTSMVTSVCSWLLYIVMLPLTILLAPFMLLKSAVETSESETVEENVLHEEEVINYVEESDPGSELRWPRSGKRKVSVDVADNPSEEGSGICSRFCSGLLFVLSLLVMPITVPINWIRSTWSGSSDDGEDIRRTKRHSKRLSTVTRTDTENSRTSYSEKINGGAQNLCDWLIWIVFLPFYIIAAPFVWTFRKLTDWYQSRSYARSSRRTSASVSFMEKFTESVSSAGRSACGGLWYILTLPFLLVAAPFIWLWRKISSGWSGDRTGRRKSFVTSVKESVSSAGRSAGSWLWYILTLPFLLVAVPFEWLWRKINRAWSSGQTGRRKSFLTSIKESTVTATKKTGTVLWSIITWPFFLVAAPFVWIWRKSTSWYYKYGRQSRRNAYKGAKTFASSCCGWLLFILTLPLLILSAPFMWLWRRGSAIKEWVKSGASSTAGLFSNAASAAGNILWTLLMGTWWLICLPFTLTSQGIQKVASSDAARPVAWLWSSDGRSRKRGGGGAGLCCCWCLPLLLIPLLAWLLYPGVYEKVTNVTSSTTNHIVTPPVVLPVGVGSRDDEQTQALLAALNQQREKLDTESARIGGIVVDMKDKDNTIAALKSEMAGLQAALVSGQAANSEAVAGVALDMKDKIAALQGEIDSQKALLAALMAQVKDCCKNDTALALWVADLVRQEMAGFTTGGGLDSSPQMKAWVHNGFLSKSDADAQLAALAGKIQAQVLAQAEKDRAAIIAASSDTATQAATEAAIVAATQSATQAATAAATASATKAATAAATSSATDAATSAATSAAISAATDAAIHVATRAATSAAGDAATSAATDAAISAATAAAIGAVTDSATDAAKKAAVAAAIGVISKSADEAAAKVATDVTKIAAAAARAEYQEIKSKEDKNGIAAGAAAIMGSFAGAGLSEERVRTMIKEALMLFAADRNNMPDYALESTGGSVLSTRCSETYHRQTAQLSLFGIPLYYSSNSPRTVIQPDVHPGQCWAFKGNQGFLVIQLATLIKVEAFTLEHIPKSLSPNGNIDSAPRNFTVLGLEHEKHKEGTVLGRYIYEESGEPMQYFIAQNQNLPAFHLVELRVESNWGNKQYTCLYRFRVHGKPV